MLVPRSIVPKRRIIQSLINMTRETENWAALQEFVSREAGVKKHRISLDSKIEKDLGISGGDAEDFMERFVEHFNLDYSGFNMSMFFNSEGFDPIGLGNVMRRLLGRKPLQKQQNARDLDMSILLEWIEKKEWRRVSI